MAQDFHRLFPLNDDDKMLEDADLHGVELAAIQGLNQKLQEELNHQAVENTRLKQQNDLLTERLNEIEAVVKSITEKK